MGETQRLLRDLTPLVLGVLVRRYRDFAGCEDAVQEALEVAAGAKPAWPRPCKPGSPRSTPLMLHAARLADAH